MIEIIRHSCVNLVTLNNAIKFAHKSIAGVDILHAYDRLNGKCLGPSECVFAAGLVHSKFMHNQLADLLSRAAESLSELPPRNIYSDYVPPLESILFYLDSVCVSRSSVDARDCELVQSALQSAVLLSDYHDRTLARRFGVKCLDLGFYNASANCLIKTGLGFEHGDMLRLVRKLIHRVFFVETSTSLDSIFEPAIALWSLICSELNVVGLQHDPRVPGITISDFLTSRKSNPIAAAMIKATQVNMLVTADFGALVAPEHVSDQQFDLY